MKNNTKRTGKEHAEENSSPEKIGRAERNQRNQLIVKLYARCQTKQIIARRVGLSAERVRQILVAAGITSRGWNLPPKRAANLSISRQTPEDRFWAKVDRSRGPDECWLWEARNKSKNGRYGRMNFAGHARYAHQLAWLFSRGEFSKRWILHSCPHSLCCNPRHLEEGGSPESVRRRVQRERTARGEQSGMAKLTAREVLEIRSEATRPGYSRAATARRYHVHPVTITNLVSRRSWKHL